MLQSIRVTGQSKGDEDMLFSMSSLIILGLGMLAIILPHLTAKTKPVVLSDRTHRIICCSLFLVGCFIRVFRLGTLPDGISAEEALVGVQAKALWQTGGFLFDEGWTTQFAQWAGESAGPLLAVLTAPFVGLFGMTTWTTRLPLALLSCAAMPAMYGIGDMVGGRRAARWCLAAYAVCPYFVLAARMTASAHAAVFILPLALYCILLGMKRTPSLYIGMVMLGLLAYAQNMYFFIAPCAVLLCGVFAVLCGVKKRHALCSSVLGMLMCFPAVLTLYVNLNGLEDFTLWGWLHIPSLENFDKAQCVAETLIPGYEAEMLRRKFWAVITGGVFQILTHMNISAEIFAPKGLGALYLLSVPLMALGAFSLIRSLLQGIYHEKQRILFAVLLLLLACISVFWLFAYGSIGVLDVETGATSLYDYSSLLLFDVMLMAAGLCHMERRSAAGTGVLGALLAVSFVILCTHLFGQSYQDNAQVYFAGFDDLARRAEVKREESGAKVNVTGTVYPHLTPSDAAEMMYLYAADREMGEIQENRRRTYDVIYAPGIENPNEDEIYLVAQNDITMWDLSRFKYEEMGEYVLLTPIDK